MQNAIAEIKALNSNPQKPSGPPFANMDAFRKFLDRLITYIGLHEADDVPLETGFYEVYPEYASLPAGTIEKTLHHLLRLGVLVAFEENGKTHLRLR